MGDAFGGPRVGLGSDEVLVHQAWVPDVMPTQGRCSCTCLCLAGLGINYTVQARTCLLEAIRMPECILIC